MSKHQNCVSIFIHALKICWTIQPCNKALSMDEPCTHQLTRAMLPCGSRTLEHNKRYQIYWPAFIHMFSRDRCSLISSQWNTNSNYTQDVSNYNNILYVCISNNIYHHICESMHRNKKFVSVTRADWNGRYE